MKPDDLLNKLQLVNVETGKLVEMGPSSGFAISGDEVWLLEDDVWRRATRKEALQIRTGARFAFGESIADIAGIEPE